MLEAFIPWDHIVWQVQLVLRIWLGVLFLSMVLCYIWLRQIAASEQDNQKPVN